MYPQLEDAAKKKWGKSMWLKFGVYCLVETSFIHSFIRGLLKINIAVKTELQD